MVFYEYKNGRFESVDSLDCTNRGFLYGDGFFETFLVIDGLPSFWNERKARINSSFAFLQMEPSFSMDELLIAMLGCLKNHSNGSYRARLTFFRNSMGKYLPQGNDVGIQLQIELINDLKFNILPSKKVDFGFHTLPSNTAGNYKLIAKHDQVLAALEAQNRGLEDLILLNDRSEVSETLSGNIFLVKGDAVVTPALKSACLNGTIRAVLLNHGWAVEGIIQKHDVESADSLFSTNSITGITPLSLNGSINESQKIEQLKEKVNAYRLSSEQDLLGNQP